MDGFSNLPEHTIHHIMSILPTEDATHMSILSKTFYSSWQSFPIMDFDYGILQRTCSSLDDERDTKHSTESFLEFIVNSLQHRRLTTCLEKLRLFLGVVDCRGSDGDGSLSFSDLDESRIDRIINFSIENKVRELDIDFGRVEKNTGNSLPDLFSGFPTARISARSITTLTPSIFDAQSIKILTLKNLKSVPTQDLIFNSPCMENLNLIGCDGFKTITLASNAKLLKALNVTECNDVKDIRFDSTALCLESFSWISHHSWLLFPWETTIKFNITGSTAPNLKHLQLINHSIQDGLIESNLSEFRQLETLKINSRYASNKMVKFNFECLKTLELGPRVDFRKLEIQAPNMVSFTHKSFSRAPSEIDISSSSSANLKHLQFHGKCVPDIWVKHNFSQFLCLETLELHNCITLENIKLIRFEYLKSLKLVFCEKLSKVEIQAPNMVSFMYSSNSSLCRSPEIDISSSCTNLKHLVCHGIYVPDIWVKNNFSQFLSLEILELHNCSRLKNIKLHLKYLKRLELASCKELSNIEIKAPKLVSFIYKDNSKIIYAPQLIITSIAKLNVQIVFYSCQLDEYYYIGLRNFIESFAQHCQTLKLTFGCWTSDTGENWIFPNELRQKLASPLYNLKHLKVQFLGLRLQYLTILLDSLLWLAPHPNIISFISGSKVKSLKFHYKNENQSWVQDLKEVTMENFEDFGKSLLEDYFKSYCEEKEERVNSFDVKRDYAS